MAALTSNLVQQPLHFSRQTMESTDGSVSMDSSDNFDRDSVNIDNGSCCSDDTVLSVGNENPNQDCNSEPLTFKNIENHLNAISQISTSVSSESSPKISTNTKTFSKITEHVNINPNRLYNQHNLKEVSDNDDNPRIKFSIDNILKADFGRRITDPLHIKKIVPKRVVPEPAEETKVSGPVDLSKTDEKEKKDEKQPILWPAWVYCTRYSDRPSSARGTGTMKLLVLEGKVKDRRPRGRSPTKRAEQLKTLERKSLDEVVHMIQDRSHWRP
ncbi:homeobox protein invected-like [Diabrotica undecimpunctata]|uniref:homeobox protein invected-like n=1 Tax=Diabrotica undecimpunctata TaxID=50387 RepID=UPI003B6380B6